MSNKILILPNLYNYYDNIYLKDVIDIFEKSNIQIKMQIVNHNTQVIAVIISFNNTDLFLPVRPSKIYISIPFEFMEDNFYGNDFELTIQLYEKLRDITNGEIYLEQRAHVLENDLLVGFITNTNQFVPVTPVSYDKLRLNPDDNYQILNSSNEYIIDEKLLLSTEKDEERIISVKKLI